MKKLYLFFVALLTCSAIASAADWDIVLKVTGADRIEAYTGDQVSWSQKFDPEKGTKIDLVEGDNDVKVPENKTLFVKRLYDTDIFSFKTREGYDVYSDQYDWYQIEWASWKTPVSPYTISAISEENYRDNSVTITMDDYSKVKITRIKDYKVFEPTENTITIPYNSDEETKFRIAPRDNSYTLYKVMVGEDEVNKTASGYYDFDLADAAEDAIVNVTTKFPEGLKFKTTITVDGPKEIVSYIEINDEKFEDIDAYLTDAGFEVEPNSDIYIGINGEYKLEELDDNGKKTTDVYNHYPIENIDCDHNVVIKGREFKTFDVTFNVTGAAGFKLEFEEKSNNYKEIKLIDGVNTISFIEDKTNCKITQNDDCTIISATNKDGKSIFDPDYYTWEYYKYFTFVAEEGQDYTIIAQVPEKKTATVTMDDCSLVTIVADGKDIKPETNTVEVEYTVKPDAQIIIEPRSFSGAIYKVAVDGTDIERGKKDNPKSTYFYIPVVSGEDDDAVYVQNIDVTANFPEGLKYKTTISLEGPQDMIKYIKLNDVAVENIADYLTADGFECDPMTNIAIGLYDNLFTFSEISDNGNKQYTTQQVTIDGIVADHNIVIKGTAIVPYDVKFNITGAEGIVLYLNDNEYDLVEGENTLKATVKANSVDVMAADGWDIVTFTDANDYNYLEEYTWTGYQYVSLELEEGEEYTIVAKKIERNDEIVVYFEDYEEKNLSFSYFVCAFENYEDPTDEVKPGYNKINFRKEDGYFKLYASNYYDYDNLIVYKNGEFMEPAYDKAKYREDEDVANGDVYKVFFDNDPGVHNVTFNVEDGALDGYEVKKDIIADADVTAPVKAVGPTRFTIAPVAKAASAGLVVKLGDNEIEAVDGVYTFETTADATVNIAAAEVKGWEINLNIAKGADLVDAKIGKNYENATAIELNDGENTFTIPEDQYLYVTAKETSYKVTFKDATGADINKALFQNYYIIYADKNKEPKNPYTLSVVDPAAAVETFDVVFNITGAEGLVAKYASTGEKINFVDGENTIAVPEDDTEIIFALADNDKYKWVTFTDGEYDGLEYEKNGKIDWWIDKGVEYTIVIEKAAPKTFDVVFNITGAEGLVATYASTGEKINFVDGENTIAVPEDDRDIIFALADNDKYKWVTFTDGNYNGLNYIEDGKIYWEIDKGVEYTIVIEKIPTTGIDAILNDANGPVDVYNLQGVRVLRDATADDVKALTPGFYIVNRQKVLVK